MQTDGGDVHDPGAVGEVHHGEDITPSAMGASTGRNRLDCFRNARLPRSTPSVDEPEVTSPMVTSPGTIRPVWGLGQIPPLSNIPKIPPTIDSPSCHSAAAVTQMVSDLRSGGGGVVGYQGNLAEGEGGSALFAQLSWGQISRESNPVCSASQEHDHCPCSVSPSGDGCQMAIFFQVKTRPFHQGLFLDFFGGLKMGSNASRWRHSGPQKSLRCAANLLHLRTFLT